MTRSAVATLLTLLAIPSIRPPSAAQDWPQWRGPGRDGVVSAAAAPSKWPEKLSQGWKVEVGEGYSSPIVAGNHIFVHTRKDPDEVVMAIDRTSGKVVWKAAYPAPYTKQSDAAKMAKGPHATPLWDDGKLYTIGASAIVSAWDAPSGRLLWRRDYSKTVDSSKLFCGTAASPLLVGGLLVVQAGSDVHGGSVIVLDPESGAEKWKWTGPGPGYASPIAIRIGNKYQIVTLTEKSIVGLDSANGSLIWTAPFPDTWNENIVTPLWTGDRLIVSGTRQGTHAFSISETDGKWQATEAWKNPAATMYMSSPVFGDGLIYGHINKKRGQFVALDAKTGDLRWASDGRDGDQASVLLTPNNIVYVTNGGDMVVARRKTSTFEVERKYKVADAEIWAMPVLAGTDLYVRDTKDLTQLIVR
jgi:outer membrane protein assembly factor BamB